MTPVRIVTRRHTDVDRCVTTLRTVHESDGYPVNWPADPHAWLIPPGLLHSWIATGADGTVAGHVALVGDAGGRPVEVSRLFVHPDHRRASVATGLLGEVRSWAAEHGRDLVLEVVDEGRAGAIAFYEATGWRFTHATTADWTTPDGRPVRLRHYILAARPGR
ncbi:GNAT family N-acetyltransferase [Actinoplanes sp. NPDC051851]|uniref:GNAT family N-acetyltransferase n=1 Tax=Actinoplanes sp. NPDC051851 TaxID=3154753 RepID=UPI0034230D83